MDFQSHLSNKSQSQQQPQGSYQKFMTKLSILQKFPADREIAERHKNGVKFGFQSKAKNAQKCLCCGNIVVNQQFGFCSTSMNDNRLGASVVLFFEYIKLIIVYLIIRFIVTDLYSIYTNFAGDDCRKDPEYPCDDQFFINISTARKYMQTEQMFILDILNLAVVVISIIFFTLGKRRLFSIYMDVDKENTSQEDYALYMENIPILEAFKGRTSQLLQYEMFVMILCSDLVNEWAKQKKQQYKDQKVINDPLYNAYIEIIKKEDIQNLEIVHTVDLCWNLNELNIINNIKQIYKDQSEEKSKEINKRQIISSIDILNLLPFTGEQSQIELTLQSLNIAYMKLCRRYATLRIPAFCISHFTGRVFVTFTYQVFSTICFERLRYLAIHDPTRIDFRQGGIIHCQKADDPTEINWHNMNVKDSQRNQKVFISFLITVGALIFAFAIIIAFNYLKYKLSFKVDQTWTDQIQIKIVSYGASLFIILVNWILTKILQTLVEYESHEFVGKTLRNYIRKLLIAQFFNTALIYYIIIYLVDIKLWDDSGLILQISSLFTTTAVIQLFTNFIYTDWVIRYVTLWFKYPNPKEPKPILTFQQRYHADYELPNFDFATRYVYYLLQIYMISFFGYITPIGSPLLIIVLSLQIYIDKFNLFYRASMKTEFGFNLVNGVLKLTENSVFIFALGNLVFSLEFNKDKVNYFNVINLVSLIIATLYIVVIWNISDSTEKKLLLPKDSFSSFQTKFNSEDFQKTYTSQNPATTLLTDQKGRYRSSVQKITKHKLLDTLFTFKQNRIKQKIQ